MLSYKELVKQDFENQFSKIYKESTSVLCSYFKANEWTMGIFDRCLFLEYLEMYRGIRYTNNVFVQFTPINNTQAYSQTPLDLKPKKAEKIRVYKRMPNGWKPSNININLEGCMWINNGQSRFAKDTQGNRLFKYGLLVVNKDLYAESLRKKKIKRE